MANHEATQPTDIASADVAVTTPTAFLDSLPPHLAADTYARYLASECDRLDAAQNDERDRRYEAEGKYHEQLFAGARSSLKLVELNGTIERLKAQRLWTAREVVTVVAVVGWVLIALAFVIGGVIA